MICHKCKRYFEKGTGITAFNSETQKMEELYCTREDCSVRSGNHRKSLYTTISAIIIFFIFMFHSCNSIPSSSTPSYKSKVDRAFAEGKIDYETYKAIKNDPYLWEKFNQ